MYRSDEQAQWSCGRPIPIASHDGRTSLRDPPARVASCVAGRRRARCRRPEAFARSTTRPMWWAHPDLALKTSHHSFPDDPYVGDQWHLENLGQDGRRPGIDMNVETAWQITDGAGQLIAILDTGVDLLHILTFVVIPGYDYIGRDDDPSPDREADDDGYPHGTASAGFAAARASTARNRRSPRPTFMPSGCLAIIWKAPTFTPPSSKPLTPGRRCCPTAGAWRMAATATRSSRPWKTPSTI